MKLTFLGGADEVGASSTLIEIAGKRILVDAGIRISPRTSRGIQNSQLPDLQPISASGGPDFILVTHAHTDHTGALPLVVEQYPNVPVIGTRPTLALVQVLQKDAQRIMKSRQEAEGELPLFDEVSVQRLLDAWQLVEFNQPIKLGEGLQVTYRVSGHIAGAAMLILESSEGTLVMSGDVSMSEQRTVKSVDVPRIRADALVIESTYGGKLHANRVAEERRLIETLKRVTERGGKALIPAFALGRAQEVIQIILAYRDQIDAPVYVDGMVRSVCDAYHRFQDLLPEKTVRFAGDNHLFFRNNIHPVSSAEERTHIATAAEPAVIVASSGMLTGGASVAYAKYLAPDERNAIFLTGYQDEEAPGRFLQRMLRERQQGETPTLKLDDATVKVRCEIGNYSLSAHADEAEIISIAEAFKPDEIMLVHGDHGARHSIATGLRQRQRSVKTPKIGQTYIFTFKNKPWAIGQVKSGSEKGKLDLEKLWESLKAQAGNYFSARELAQAWWGDGTRAEEIMAALGTDQNIYFSADWRNKTNYMVRSEDQVKRVQRCRAVMLANPDIVGKLVVLRNSNNQPRLGVVNNADIDSFDAIVQGAKGSRNPADALVWVIGTWEGYKAEVNGQKRSVKAQLSDLMTDARAQRDNFLPFSTRQSLVAAGQPINPEMLLPETYPEGTDAQIALTSIVLTLSDEGAEVVQEGLLPKRALSAGPMEQNTAREYAFSAFPPEARLKKVGIQVHRQQLLLTFDFPPVAQRHYSDIIEKVIYDTGWDVRVKPTVSQQALAEAVNEVLPDGAGIIKGPSFYMDRSEVHVEVGGVEDTDAVKQAYLEMTGHRLVIGSAGDGAAETETLQTSNPLQMEINAAYGLIRAEINDDRLNKTSLKQGQIVLAFISPQVGERYREQLAALAEKTGYPLSIHPHPNQQQIMQVANAVLREQGWSIRKGPGLHMDRAEVAVSVAENVDDATAAAVSAKLEEATGYKLVVG